MSTRSQKRRNVIQESTKKVNESVVPPISVGNGGLREPGAMVGGPSHANSPRFENSTLETLRDFLEKEIASGNKNILLENKKIVETTQARKRRKL